MIGTNRTYQNILVFSQIHEEKVLAQYYPSKFPTLECQWHGISRKYEAKMIPSRGTFHCRRGEWTLICQETNYIVLIGPINLGGIEKDRGTIYTYTPFQPSLQSSGNTEHAEQCQTISPNQHVTKINKSCILTNQSQIFRKTVIFSGNTFHSHDPCQINCQTPVVLYSTLPGIIIVHPLPQHPHSHVHLNASPLEQTPLCRSSVLRQKQCCPQ